MENNAVASVGSALKRHSSAMLLFTALLGLAFVARAVPPPIGDAAIVSPQGGFGIDGNLLSGLPDPAIGDWIPGPSGSGGAVLDPTGAPINPALTFHFIDPFGGMSAELIFSGGLKWTDNPNTWSWTTGKPSSKTDINNVLLHISEDTNGHIWSIISADRASTSGDSYIDFELLQNVLVKTNGGAFVSAGPHGGRTVNDMLLSLAFTGGGKVADFFAWRWLPDGAGGYAYVDATASLPIGKVFVALNSNTIAVPYGAFGANTYTPNAFAEAAVDLTALLGNFDPCLSFGVKSIMVKTKASSSSSASIEDFIDPIQYSLRIGPGADAGPDITRCTEGASTSFTMRGKASSGLGAVASTTWSVVEGDATIDAPATLTTTVRVSSAKAILRLTVVQANGCTAADDIVLWVSPLPACAIAGPAVACPNSVQQYNAPPAQDGYAWNVSGAAAILGSTNSASVSIVVGPGCDETFLLSLVTTSNNCSSACSFEGRIQDTNAPLLHVPANVVLEIPSDTSTNATGVASATDDCGAVTVSFVDSVTNFCGATKVIARTWAASDSCGNTTSAVQLITLQDTTPPVLVCPPDRILECPSGTTADITGTATATDKGGPVVITSSDVVTNGCGGTRVILRTWSATDECGNVASAVQKITVQDTTLPSLVIPPDIMLECPNDGGTNLAGVAISQDACGTVAMAFSDVVLTNCAGTRTIARTWTAVDECGNATNKTQTITVQDTRPPTLTCPPDLVLECPADTGTNATGVALASDACGQVTIRFNDHSTNVCGSAEGIVRTWTAVDECGNSVSAAQVILVRDTSAPSITAPPNLTLECPGNPSTNATGVAVASDDCGSVQVAFADVETDLCGNTRIISRTWTAIDQCGNSSKALQVITVMDTAPPAIVSPPDITLECPSDGGTDVAGTAIATDLCGGVAVRFADAVNTGCGGTKTISRTWTATDDCGNSTNKVQTITIRDTQPPEITAPADRIVECGTSTEPSATGAATGSDLCGVVTVRYSDTVTNVCGASKVIFRTWTATDACGNYTNKVQTITVRDTTPPALILPANVVMECPGDTRTNLTGTATAQDICGSAAIIFSDVVTNGCGSTRTVMRLWIATDQCGNTTNGLQIITVVDTQPPVATCPAVAVQCVSDIPTPYADLAAFLAAGGKATDTCDSALSFSLISDSGLVGSCPGTVTRVYRLIDDCGNYSDTIQTITVSDTIKPSLTCPPAVTLECARDSMDPASTGWATAIDNCDTNVAITYSDTVVGSSYNIKWYASDPNPDHAPYLPTYMKLAPDSLRCPESVGLTGRAADPLRNAVAFGPATNLLDALTSLGGEPMHFGQIVPFQAVIGLSGGPGPENGTIEFTASWSTHTTSNNDFGYDKNYMVLCAFVDIADPGTIDPHQNARVESFRSALTGEGSVDEKIRGTFRVSGLDVGDQVVVEVWVALKSAPAGSFGGTIASDLVSAEKVLAPPVPISIGNQTVSIGNLSKITPLPPPQEQPPLPPLPGQPPAPTGRLVSVMDRMWVATDDCGNTSTCSQRITIRDSATPSIIIPPDVVLEAPADTSTNITGVATAQDACGPVQISFRDAVVTNCGITRTISRTWSATDGYSTTNAVQLISLVDTTSPVFASQAAEAGFVIDGDPWSFDEPMVSDACGAVVLTVLSTTTNTLGDALSVTRTWQAVDECGNSATTQQTLSVLRPPVVGAAPICQTVRFGGGTLLTVSVTGSGPLAYQWSLNGVIIPGATGSSLEVSNANFANAGLYSVSISNAASGVISPVAVVNVAPQLTSELSGRLLKLSWPQGYVLQYAGNPAGPYINVPSAGNPYYYDPASGPMKFFRLRSMPATVSASSLPDGSASLLLSGSPGCTFVIQRSTDGVNWLNLLTNTAPCTYIDQNARDYPGCSYRAIQALQPEGPRTPPVILRQPENLIAPQGGAVTLSGEFNSATPVLYQWQRNGADIPGATSSSLTLHNVGFANAGVYRLIAGNTADSVISQSAIVNVAPRLSIKTRPNGADLSWEGSFILQSAPWVMGPYIDVSAAPIAGSWTALAGTAGPQRFYRLKSAAFSLQTQFSDGNAILSLTGSPGCNFAIQTSTDLTSWMNVSTNTAPASLVISNATAIKLFRAVPVP